MPQLRQPTTEVKQFFLPSTASLPEAEQAWVKMDVGQLLAGDVMDVIPENEVSPGGISGEMLAGRIKEWNFTKDDGSPEDINLASVRRLEPEDLTYLFEQLNITKATQLLTDDQKKT